MVKVKTSRKFMILIALGLIILHVLVAVYLIMVRAKISMLEREGQELSAVTNLLQLYVQEEIPGILTTNAPAKDSKAQLKILHKTLSPVVESLASTHPGQAVGFYSTKLNTIICYAPEKKYQNFIGVGLAENNPLKQAFKKSQLKIAPTLDGKSIISVRPVKLEAGIVGYVFAYQSFKTIEQGLAPVSQKALSMVLVGFLEAVLLLFLWDLLYNKSLKRLKLGVQQLSRDLSKRLPTFRGELGVTASLINNLAESLMQSRSFSDQLMESLPVAVVVKSNGNENMIYNLAAVDILNLQKSGFINDPQSPIYLLEDTLKTGKTFDSLDFSIKTGDSVKYLLVKTNLIENDFNNSKTAILIAWDVTEYRLMEAQLRQAEKLTVISELAAGTAHEIRNPLTSVRGLVQILSTRFNETSPEHEHFKVILRDIDRINLIIKELYLLSTPIKPKLHLTDITAMIEESILTLKNKVPLSNITLDKVLAKNLPQLNLDRDQINMALSNFFKNAVEAMPRGGVLGIHTSYDSQSQTIQLEICDSGEGIPPENLERVFDPFFTTRDDGIGLGLNICYQVIKNHNGKLLLNSEPGKGSKFIVLLPTA